MDKKIDVIIDPRYIGTSIVEIKKEYYEAWRGNIDDYLNNPSPYQEIKNSKHTGTFLGADKRFASKWNSEIDRRQSITETVQKGTFGIDDKGRLCIWHKKDDLSGEFRANPNDFGTQVSAVKIVLLYEKGKTHAFLEPDIESYQMIFLLNDINSK